MRHIIGSQCGRFIRRLFCVCGVSLLLTTAGLTDQPHERSDLPQHFIELDSEVQAIKEEILAIKLETLAIKELALYPPGEGLVVFVSVETGSLMTPSSIRLELDGQSIHQHEYTASEGDALLQGGVHRIYAGRLREGEHNLDVFLSVGESSDRSFSQQHSLNFTKAPGQKYLELQVGTDKRGSRPDMIIRQWQQ